MTYPLTRSIPDASRERWEQSPVKSVIGGLNTQERPDTLSDDQVIDILNMFVYKAEARRDTGYSILGDGATLDSMLKDVREYVKSDGTKDLIGITKGSVYKYSTTTTEWEYVKGTAGTDLNGAFVTGNTVLTVDDSTGFLATDKIGIRLANGKQYRTTISAIPDGTHITIVAPGLPSAASDEGAIVRAVVLSGSDDFAVVSENIPGSVWLVFTNNVDYIKRYNGTDCVDVPGLTTTTAQSLALYNSALFLFNTTEGGTSYPTRVRRSEIGDPTTWSGGTAGYDDLLDTPGNVLSGAMLGPYLIVYKQRTIYRGQFANSGGKYYQFDAMVHGDNSEGLMATKGIVNTGTFHAIIGNANIYQYVGDFNPTPIGDQIFHVVFSPEADVSIQYINRAFGVYVEALNEIWFLYTSSSGTWPDRMVRYNLKTQAWTRRVFDDPMSCAGIYSAQKSFTWDDLVGIWSDQVWTWNSVIASGTIRPMIVMGDADADGVYVYDFVTAKDSNATITGVVTTRDFLWAGGSIRTDRVEGFIQSVDVTLDYSTDQGVTWQNWDTVSSEPTMGKFQSYNQVVCDIIRFRFTSSDPNFRIRWFNLIWRPESVSSLT